VCTNTARRLHVVGILSYWLDNPEFDSRQLQETIPFPEYPYRLWSPRSLLFEYYRRLSRQENLDHVKSDHSSPIRGLRITAATSLLVLNAFMACTRTALPLPLFWWHELPSVFRQRQRIFLWGTLIIMSSNVGCFRLQAAATDWQEPLYNANLHRCAVMGSVCTSHLC